MSELLGALLVLVAMVGILMLMIPGMRPTSITVPQGRKAHTFGFLYQYGEGAGWGVALMAGFAVYEILLAVAALAGPRGTGLATLAYLLCAVVGLSCTFRTDKGAVWQLPASLVGAAAAVWKSAVLIQKAWVESDWLMVAEVVALAVLFLLTVTRRLARKLSGLAWFTALEVMLFLASPFGVDLVEMGGWSIWVMTVVRVVVPMSLAVLPFVVLNIFAVGIVIAEVTLGTMGLGEMRFEAWFFAGITWGVYWLVGRVRSRMRV